MTASYVVVRRDAPPRTYLWLALLTTFVFCPPAGLLALICSSRVTPRWTAGDRRGAWAAARASRNWSFGGIFVGLVVAFVVVFWAGTAALQP